MIIAHQPSDGYGTLVPLYLSLDLGSKATLMIFQLPGSVLTNSGLIDILSFWVLIQPLLSGLLYLPVHYIYIQFQPEV